MTDNYNSQTTGACANAATMVSKGEVPKQDVANVVDLVVTTVAM